MAIEYAEAKLQCVATPTAYLNTRQTYTASCTSDAQHPTPEGNDVTEVVEAGTVTSTTSQAEADAQAQALARSNAESRLSCTFFNKEITKTVACPSPNQAITASATVAAKSHSATTQIEADNLASLAVTNAANALLTCPAPKVWNTGGHGTVDVHTYCSVQPQVGGIPGPIGPPRLLPVTVSCAWSVDHHVIQGDTVELANAAANAIAELSARAKAELLAASSTICPAGQTVGGVLLIAEPVIISGVP
jgi:hypothetical protein